MALTKAQQAMLSPQEVATYVRLPRAEQEQLEALLDAHAAALAKADARLAKQTRFLQRAAIANRVTEALGRAGGEPILQRYVEERVRATERDGAIAGFHVVDQDGQPRVRDGRPMQVEELIGELRRSPELARYFTKNGRHA